MNDLKERASKLNNKVEALNFRVVALGSPQSKDFVRTLSAIIRDEEIDEIEELSISEQVSEI